MKYLPIIILIPFFFSSCSNEPLVGDFAMEYIEDLEIPAGLPPLGASFFILQDIPSRASDIFAANGVLPEEVQEIKASFVSLESLNPSTGNYNFLREVTLLIETNDLPRIDVGYRDQIFDPGTRLDLIPAITNVSDYVKSDFFNLVLQLEPNAINQSFISTRLRVEFQVFLE